MILNSWIEKLIRLQLHNHGQAPVVVVLPDGTRCVPTTHEIQNGVLRVHVAPMEE